jgi:hypothetical protein
VHTNDANAYSLFVYNTHTWFALKSTCTQTRTRYWFGTNRTFLNVPQIESQKQGKRVVWMLVICPSIASHLHFDWQANNNLCGASRRISGLRIFASRFFFFAIWNVWFVNKNLAFFWLKGSADCLLSIWFLISKWFPIIFRS